MKSSRTGRGIDRRVKKLLALMSLPEKIAQLGSWWIYELQTGGELDDIKLRQKIGGGIGQITRNVGASRHNPREAARSMNRIQKFLKEETRLGIPAIDHEECCAGFMAPGATIFPQMIGLASTFRPELAARMTTAIRRQMRAAGAHQGLAPVLDVARDPRWGRVEETFGEDPLLASQFGAAYVRGLQGDDLKTGIMATGKHFIGHALSQGGLNCGPVQIGRRELFETYLAPFHAAVRDAGLVSMMNAYPELDGEVVAASRPILTGLLRDILGFDGLVVSDYEAIAMIHNYHYAAESLKQAAVRALDAGIDVELPSICGYGEDLLMSVESGQVPLEQIDRSVARHLQKKYELGLFENPFVDEGLAVEVTDTLEDRSLAYQIACESLVLLTNDGTLPLSKSIRRLAVIGPNANSSRNLAGDYSYAATASLLAAAPPEGSIFGQLEAAELEDPGVPVPTILDALRLAAGPGITVSYSQGCETRADNQTGFTEAAANAARADAVILVLGDRSGLTLDCTTGEFRDARQLGLPGSQEELARAVLAAGKPTVLVLVNGRPVAIPELAGKANAVLEAWLPGEEGGTAVAKAIFGEVNPGGKLPITVPRSVGQVPVYYNHKPSGMFSNIYGDYIDQTAAPLFPFGHGLSYTTFEFSSLTIDKPVAAPGEAVSISLTVKNTGKTAGDEVVQLYVRDIYARLPRPVKELKGFVRLSLKPSESRQVIFHLPVNQMAYFDENLNLVVEVGKILVMVGISSTDIRLNGEFDISAGHGLALNERILDCPVEIR